MSDKIEELAMETFDLYAFPHDDLKAAREALEEALGIQMEPHESMYWGDPYYLFEEGKECFQLLVNAEPLAVEEGEEDPRFEREVPLNFIILYYSNLEDPERARYIERTLIAKIPGIRLVKREEK
ncbi:MAG: hypothetical protein QXD59_08455 [Candidatus Caldarchaeum sp.]